MIYHLFIHSRQIRQFLIKYYSRKEKGIWRSTTLRAYYKKWKDISVGIGSYGWSSDALDGPMTIGNYCSLGPGVRRLSLNHPLDGVTTHPCWFNPIYNWVDKDFRTKSMLSIGHDVWIGANAIILPGVHKIGNGAVIAAGAIVTKDVPPYEIWGGSPARFIKRRFPLEKASLLEKTEWWNLSESELKKKKDLFNNIDLFIQSFK